MFYLRCSNMDKVVAVFGVLCLSPCLPFLSYTHISSHMAPGQVDMWTVLERGCPCPTSPTSLSGLGPDTGCACCADGGCPCPADSPNSNRCVQCGLERHCGNMCNVTISAEELKIRSGRLTGELKSSSDMQGPAFCYYRFLADPGYRVELHLYRILRIGRYIHTSKKCEGGGIQFTSWSGDQAMSLNGHDLIICGDNERFSPPVVMFRQENPTLFIQIHEPTERSQFFAHFSFTPESEVLTGVHMVGGRRQEGSDCSWEFSNCSGQICQFSSPGYPGIFPQNAACRYTVNTQHPETRLKINFLKFNLPKQDRFCGSTYIIIYKGGTEVTRLCGIEQTSSYSFSGSDVTIEFRSGLISPPFIYNGFLASLEVSDPPPTTPQPPPPPPQHPPVDGGARQNRPWHNQQDQQDFSEMRDSKLSDQQLAPQLSNQQLAPKLSNQQLLPQQPGQLPDLPGLDAVPKVRPGKIATARIFTCNEEIVGEGEGVRAARFSSVPTTFHHNTCSLVFRGGERDVVLLKLYDINFSQSPCAASSLRISVQDHSEKNGIRVVREFCNSTVNTAHHSEDPRSFPIIVNSSLVFLDFITNNPNRDSFRGAFRFNNVLLEGFPVANSHCDVSVIGDSFPFLPKLQGYITTPTLSEFYTENMERSRCSYRLVSGNHQSSILTLSAATPSTSSPHCLTGCDGTGCHCVTRYSMSVIDHLTVESPDGKVLGCFCGNFKNELPVTYTSRPGFHLNYYTVSDNTSNIRNSGQLQFTGQYKFVKTVSRDCGQTVLTAESGEIYRPEVVGSGIAQHEECEWTLQPPPHRYLTLAILSNTIQKVHCSDWLIRIWTEPRDPAGKDDLQPSFPKLASGSENVGSLCGGQLMRKFEVADMFNKKLRIRVWSVFERRIGYKILWNSEYPLPQNIIKNKAPGFEGVTDRQADTSPVSSCQRIEFRTVIILFTTLLIVLVNCLHT